MLLATCFDDLESFLAVRRPSRLDPAGVFRRLVYEDPADDLAWLHAPEARFEEDIELSEDNLRGVFVDVDALTSDDLKRTAVVLRRLVEAAKGSYFPMVRHSGAVDYRAEVSRFVRGWLVEQGWM